MTNEVNQATEAPANTGPKRRGFEVSGDEAVLEFAKDHRLHGAEVRVSLDVSIEDILAMQERFETAGETEDDEDLTDEQKIARSKSQTQRFRAVFTDFGDDVLLDWNFTKKGNPVPANGAGMITIPSRHAMFVMRAFFAAALGVPKSD